jgi:hypothetical protein
MRALANPWLPAGSCDIRGSARLDVIQGCTPGSRSATLRGYPGLHEADVVRLSPHMNIRLALGGNMITRT